MLAKAFQKFRAFFSRSQGSSPVVSFVILAPLVLVVAFGISWMGHMADAQNVVEEAARAGARWLAAHPGDIDGAKARAAEVVEGTIGGKYIAGGSIDSPSLGRKLIGKLTKIGHKYYIADKNLGSVRVKPANGSIKTTMDSMLNRTVVADGTWKNVDVFKVNVATTNPPETQTVNQTVPEQSGENGGGGGSSNTQTVSQTRHPRPFAAAALARYGEGPWGTSWGAYPQQGSGAVPTNGALRIQATSHNTNKYSSEWTSPNGKKIYRIHIKGNSERNYDYGYVYGWNGSSWVQLAKECSPSFNTEYDKWIDVSNYNITKLKTRLTTDGSVLYNPTYVDVPEAVIDCSNSGAPFDENTWWIWGQSGADRCALNGQEVQLSKSCFLYYYATYDAYAVGDDHFDVNLNSQKYTIIHFLFGDTNWINGKVPADYYNLWIPKPGGSSVFPNPESFASTIIVDAWNDYGPAGFIFALRQTGWHWSTSFTPLFTLNASPGTIMFHYPGWTVPFAQWVSITATNQLGQAVNIYVDDWTHNKASVATGYGSCTFYAYPGTTYSVCLNSSTLNNDLIVSFDGGIVLRTDSTWQYTPVDGVSYAPVTLPTGIQPGAVFNAQVRATNTGHKEWYGTAAPSWWPSSYGNGTMRLSYHWYDQSGNLVVMDGLKTSFPGVVNPGTAINRTMTIQAPSQPGTYKLVIDSVQEDVAWFGPVQGVNWPTIEANILVGGKQRDVYFSPVAVPKYMIAGQPYTIRVTATNKGTTAWSQSKCRLGYYWVDKNGEKLNERGYDLPLNVQPGGSVTFDMTVAAPSKPGTYSLMISMASVTQNGLSWWNEDAQNPCPYLKADVQIPDGDVLQGMITYDGEDYWIGTTLLDSQGPDLSTLAGKDAIVWGDGKGLKQKIFLVSLIEEYFPSDWNAVVTFDPDKDVLCNDPIAGDPNAPIGDPVGQPRADDYAYCRVTYHYPVPLRGFWEMVSRAGVPLWRGEETPSRPLLGEAFFVSGEEESRQ